MMTTFYPLEFIGDEIEVADALLVLKSSATSSERFPRWGHTQRRSNPKHDRPSKEGVQGLSPSTPLSFSSSGGDESPPPQPVPPLPPLAGRKIYTNMEQHKEWVMEQNQMIATLSATKATLQQCIVEAKSHYQRLSGTNSWLKEMQSKMRETIIRRQLNEMRRRGGELDLFPVGPARAAVGHHRQYLNRQQQLDLNSRTADEAAEEAEWKRQAYAQARKRRIELQRVKASSLKIQRFR